MILPIRFAPLVFLKRQLVSKRTLLAEELKKSIEIIIIALGSRPQPLVRRRDRTFQLEVIPDIPLTHPESSQDIPQDLDLPCRSPGQRRLAELLAALPHSPSSSLSLPSSSLL